uniref:Uncharacterized protein n=1 Tax=Neogobius melanostomus TaxID=47308 RepID=A0A8C6T5C1_9GOBI
MASRLEQDLTCSICHELFRDPVVLICSHSFCKVCLENWWKDKPLKTCPVCKSKISMNPPLSLTLKNLVETFTEERRQTSPSPAQPECSLHSEKLRLFCEDHQDLICLVCRDSRTHKDHSFRPIEEAAQEQREQLRRDLTPLQENLKVLARSRAQLEFSEAHITAQARRAQTQIRAQFEKLHQFLREEEESRMKALREEEEQKTQRMKDMMAAVSRDMEAVSQSVSETEELLRAADASFLLQYKTAAKSLQQRPLVEEMGPGALIDQAKHLGNLGFNIWRNMQSLVQFYPVLLDPNTAGPHMILSEDLSSVRRGEKQEFPQNPERRVNYYNVFGSERFVSGTHSWDVEVGENEDWFMGVREFVQRRDDTEERLWFIKLFNRERRWFIRFFDGYYSARSHSFFGTRLSVKKKLQRVRVKLDFDTKTLTFTDLNTNTDLHTFTESFPEGLTPYLVTSKDVPLKILPRNISVTE